MLVHSIVTWYIHRNQIAPEMKKDLVNVNNELAHCEAQLLTIRLVDSQLVITDHGGSEESSSQGVVSTEASDTTASGQPSAAEYKELIACLEKANMELSAMNEQLDVKVVSLENEKTSLIEELQRLKMELQELRGGTMSAAGDVQMSDGAGENIKMTKHSVEDEQVDDKSELKSDEESEEEQEVTSVQQLEELVTEVQSEVNVIIIKHSYIIMM